MIKKQNIKSYIHYSMSVSGGFFGVYALLNHLDIFASSQTSNFIYILASLFGRNWHEMLFRLGAALLYISAIVLSSLLVKRTHLNMRLISICVNAAAALICTFTPTTADNVLALYPIFFCMAMQWCVYSGAEGYVCSSIFSTNNIKQTATALTEYFCDKDKKHLHKARFFGMTLIFYHIGVIIGYISCYLFASRGCWICILPLTISAVLVLYDMKVKKVELSKIESL
ncbi:MAG TPA: DUF1275 domain-containing protein [Firmicutes bacterium]|nr:DUF1275 domain-containing protein [Bacillota bacterium]